MRLKSTLLSFLFPLLLCACTSNVKKVDFNQTKALPENATPSPIMFRGAEFIIPPGQEIGFASSSSRYCGWPKEPISRGTLSRSLESKYLKQGFKNTLENAGYDVVSGLSLIPEENIDDELRAEYSISAKITATQLNLCENNNVNLLSPRSGTEGEAYISVNWSIYDPVRRTVAYKATSEGYAKLHRPNQEGLTLMLHEAFEMAAHNLGTDEQFYNLIVNGITPNDWQKPGFKKKRNNFESRHIFDPLEDVTIYQPGLSQEPFTKNIERKRQNAVVIHKIGHGSGFFITPQGHLITNAHVVGDSIKTGVVLANKKKRLPAEILRVDKLRDVALLKLETLPEGYNIQTAPIRTEIPSIGEDVFALGSPLHYSKMQDTLNKGIISAYRKNFTHNLVKQSYIQSDVELHAGNSGGPLYDANGNIIGISALGYGPDDNVGHGLNLFIPIAEALEALDIALESD